MSIWDVFKKNGGTEKEPAKIRECPFCGHTPSVRFMPGANGWEDRYSVLCRYDEGGCGAESGLYQSEEAAVDAWNTRRADAKREPEKKEVVRIASDLVIRVSYLGHEFDCYFGGFEQERIFRNGEKEQLYGTALMFYATKPLPLLMDEKGERHGKDVPGMQAFYHYSKLSDAAEGGEGKVPEV